MNAKDLFRSPEFYKLLMTKYYYTEKKYDGVRCISWFDGVNLKMIAHDRDKLHMYSRNGRELLNITDRFKEDLKIPNGYVFDGELFLNNFSDTMSIVMSDHPTRTPLYYVFDMVPIKTILQGTICNTPYEDRKQVLLDAISRCSNRIQYVGYKRVNFLKAIQVDEEIDLLINQGYEGAVFKLAKSPYIPKRSKLWLKGKKIFTLDLKVVGVLRSKEHVGQIQAIICNLGKLEQPVGSGLTLKQREDWFKNPSLIVGKIVEIKFVERTKQGYLRQPTFVRVRPDKLVSDM